MMLQLSQLHPACDQAVLLVFQSLKNDKSASRSTSVEVF